MNDTATKKEAMATRLRHHPLVTLRDEMDDLLSRFLGSDEGWFSGRVTPPIDVVETDTALEVTLDIPGVKADEIDICVAGNVLRVRAERPERKESKGRTSHRLERRHGAIGRDIPLSCAVEESEVAAEYRDGVLTITLPKREAAKTHRVTVKHS